MARRSSSKVCTGRPSTSVMTSPSFIPASAAGSPGSRVRTRVEGWGKLTTARKSTRRGKTRLKAGPAATMSIRFQGDWAR